MEMGKLNTARIRKAVDPKILEVKKRVRAARRSLKRESKVQLSDEIIFFDDVAGNEQAKVSRCCCEHRVHPASLYWKAELLCSSTSSDEMLLHLSPLSLCCLS
jgi:hypothetical protein